MSLVSEDRDRSVSGRAIGIGFILLAVGTVLMVLFVTPAAQREVLGILGGTNDRQVLARGDVGGVRVEVVGTLDELTSCVRLEVEGQVGAGDVACLEGTPATPLTDRLAARDLDDRWVAAGIVAPDVPLVRAALSDGTVRVLTVERPRGYRAGYWFADNLPPGVDLSALEAIDTRDAVLGSAACAGAGSAVTCQIGGQG